MSWWNQTITLKKHFFWTAFLLIAIVEALSLVTYQGAPVLGPIFLVATLVATGVLAWRNFEYGLLIASAELFVGSFGHLFSFSIGPFAFTLRMGLFLLLNGIFFIHTLASKSFSFRQSKYFWINTAFFALIVYGYVLALLHHQQWRNIFADSDAYFFFVYIPAAFAAFRTPESRDRLIDVFLASLLWLAVQTGLVLFVFSHHLRDAMQVLYYWIRDARIGEITRVAGDFYRVFFQSYIFALMGIFLLGIRFFFPHAPGSSFPHRTKQIWLFYILAAFLTLESFSRSFWFGAAMAFAAMFIVLLVRRTSWKILWRGFMRMALGALMALGLIFTIVNVPIPPKGPPLLLADIFGGRAVSLFGEAAAATRWHLLPVLWSEIKKTPVLGAGFGKTVTYQTEDPRTLDENGSGIRTTFAFEWGYLDLWLKLGIPGLLIYTWFVITILRQGWQRIRSATPITDYQLPVTELGLWLGVIALLATHVFTPYLNHPLGIGFLILTAAWFDSHEHRLVK